LTIPAAGVIAINKSELYTRITAALTSADLQAAEQLIKANRDQLSDQEHDECVGNVHFYAKRYQEAVLCYEAAIESSPDYDCARYHYLLGVQAERAGEIVNAFQRYQAAIEIEPTFVDAYIELGGLCGKIEDFEGAYQCYTDAAKLDPKDIAIRYNLVRVLSELVKKAPAIYACALRDAQVAYELASTYLEPPDNKRVW
jgi:tetratricopeptide (TPR) repeat protein